MKLTSTINQQLIENNPDSIMTTDIECKINYVNKAAIELYGYSKEELLGKHINIFEVSGKEIPKEAWGSLTQSGKWSGEATRKRKDGSTFFASLSIFTMLDENGNLTGFAGNTKDISKTISVSEALVEKQFQLSAIIDNTVDVIVSIDRDLNLVEFNQVMANFVKHGFNHNLKKGEPLLKYIDSRKHDHLKKIYERVFVGERVFDTEVFSNSAGQSIYFESSYNPIINTDKVITGISIFSKNITEKMNIEIEVKKAYRAKDILLSEIHHRLKNNLAIISSVLQLQEMNITNEAAKKCLSESRLRIKSSALLHEMLYQNESLDKLCIKEYLVKMFDDINKSMGPHPLQLNIKGDETSLSIHNAIPAGLLFNEIFTNTIKHGSTIKNKAEILINIKNIEKKTVFEITETESNFPDELDFNNTSSTGLSLIKIFTEQLKGDIQLMKKPTTKYILSLDLS